MENQALFNEVESPQAFNLKEELRYLNVCVSIYKRALRDIRTTGVHEHMFDVYLELVFRFKRDAKKHLNDIINRKPNFS